MKAKSSKRKAKHQPAATPTIWKSMRELIKGIAEAAETLGYDVHRKDWRERLREESSGYPCTLDHEAKVVALLPKAARARIRALELIDSFSDLRPRLEEVVSAADEWFTELQAEIAKGPTPEPLPLRVRHEDEEAA